VPDRLGELAGTARSGDLGAALAAQPALGALVALGVGAAACRRSSRPRTGPSAGSAGRALRSGRGGRRCRTGSRAGTGRCSRTVWPATRSARCRRSPTRRERVDPPKPGAVTNVLLERVGWQVLVADAQKVKGASRRWRARRTGSTRGCWPSCRGVNEPRTVHRLDHRAHSVPGEPIRQRKPSASGGTAVSATSPPARSSRQTSSRRRLRSSPACNMKTGLLELTPR
jgi:hypothetical protein